MIDFYNAKHSHMSRRMKTHITLYLSKVFGCNPFGKWRKIVVYLLNISYLWHAKNRWTMLTGSLTHKFTYGWFYKLPPHIVIKCLWNTFCYLLASFYIKQAAPQQFKQVWLYSACSVFGSKCKFVQSCSSLHSFTLLHFDLKNKLKI